MQEHVFIGVVVTEIKPQWWFSCCGRPQTTALGVCLKPLHRCGFGMCDRRSDLQHQPAAAQHKLPLLEDLLQHRAQVLGQRIPLGRRQTTGVQAEAEALVLQPGPRPTLQGRLQALGHSLECRDQGFGARFTPKLAMAGDFESVVAGKAQSIHPRPEALAQIRQAAATDHRQIDRRMSLIARELTQGCADASTELATARVAANGHQRAVEIQIQQHRRRPANRRDQAPLGQGRG